MVLKITRLDAGMASVTLEREGGLAQSLVGLLEDECSSLEF